MREDGGRGIGETVKRMDHVVWKRERYGKERKKEDRT
jgi:hypothetical protein